MRIAYAAPREVCDVDESVNTAEVNEYTVRSDVLDSTFKNLTLLQFADNLFLLCFQLSLNECLVRNNNVAELLVDLDNLEFHSLAYEYVVVAYGVNVNLASGQECFDAEYVYNHTALCTALDVALDDFAILESSVDALPALAQAGFLVRKNELSLLVLLILYVDFNLVAYLQFGIVAELRCGDDTIALIADVDDYFLLVDGDNFSLYDLMLRHLVEGFVVGLCQVLLVDFYVSTILKLFPIEVCQRLYVL